MRLRSSSNSSAYTKMIEGSDHQREDLSEDTASSVHVLRLRRHKSYPCDYVSDFGSLSLKDSGSIKISTSECNYASVPSFDNDDRASSIDTYSVCSESIYINDDFDDDSYDLYSEPTYQSSIHRSVKRRKFTNCSDVASDFNDSIQTEYSFSSPPHTEEISIDADKIVGGYSTKFYKLIKLLLLIFFIFVLISMVLLFTMSVCLSQNKQVIPLENLNGNLSRCLVGHEHSVPLITEAVKKFNANYLQRKIYYVWIVGPVGVGKSYTKQLIRNSLGSSVVSYSVLSSLLPKDIMAMERVVENLAQNLDICKPNVIFVDGFDDGNDMAFNFLEILFEQLNMQRKSLTSSVQSKVLVIAVGTYGSSKVNDAYVKHTSGSSVVGGRETFNMSELQLKMVKESPFKGLSKLSLDFTVVPFLPLEVVHLHKCIVRQLNYIYKNKTCDPVVDEDLERHLRENNFTLQEIQNEVLKLTSVYKTTEIIHTGCKRVYQLVSSLLFRLNR